MSLFRRRKRHRTNYILCKTQCLWAALFQKSLRISRGWQKVITKPRAILRAGFYVMTEDTGQ